ncbi:arylsulfatase [Parapedobacter pyrenivorans]|uniref:Arylsulfatase n=1 Tax=Parapedobacter pyrenivorans TaxID=1305674 RepID=A0A917HQI0_9SPHI|nr:arylsulfatase [Parapedobacter pyrenivorans]GGG86151.1 arylsulfatase [Parapedobacter pyrenivorans]
MIRFKALISYLLTICTAVSCQDQTEPGKPNIILIMSDDMGYSDIGCYGGEIETPVLDGLAESGVRFTQFYNGARCCPTRASLISGLYPHQTGIGHMTNPSENFEVHDYDVPGYRGELSQQTNTLAEVLKTAGYRTLMTGKWHLGMEHREQWPLQRGFDRFYGILDGASNYFQPVYPRGITLDNDPVDVQDSTYYTTDAFTDYAIRFINEGQEANERSPFFLYLAYTAPHWPLQAPKSVIDKYRERYHQGWEAIRGERYEKMIELGLVDPSWRLSPADGLDWDTLSSEKRADLALRRAIYAAQVDQMDRNIGRLVDYLKTNGLFENTLIVFINDNGACAEGGMLGGGKSEQLETKAGYFLTYGQSWANASNTPYREYKHWVHEGGISSPLIAHWPAGISASLRGTLINEYGFLPDIMATFADISGASYPSARKGKPVPSMVGESFLPLLKGSNAPIHDQPIFWEHEGNKAVRLGNYKAVMKWEENKPEKWELYDLSKDRTELNDLSGKEPDRLASFVAGWEEWARTHQVRPWEEMLARLRANQRRTNE